jgi:hypothetical protein
MNKKLYMRKKHKTQPRKPRPKKTRKRYKLLAGISIFMHVLGAIYVLYGLIVDPSTFHTDMNRGRYLIGLDNHEHELDYIFRIWLAAIQFRYVLTDAYASYNALVKHKLVKHTIKQHGLEGLICSFLFFYQNRKDSTMFGFICSFWTVMWVSVYYLIN